MLTDILTYHVAPGALQASQVLSGDPIATLQGAEIGVDVENLQLIDLDPGLTDPTLIATDLQAENGIVHVIDNVLQPIPVTDILGQPGTDFEIGGPGSEIFHTGDDADFVDGNGGRDRLFLGSGDDVGDRWCRARSDFWWQWRGFAAG